MNCFVVINKASIFTSSNKQNRTIMKNQEKQLEEILNSELMNQIIEQEDKDLKEAGWTYSEVQSLAKEIIKASK